MSALRSVFALSVLVLATGGSARAEAPWSPPIDLGPPTSGAKAVGLAFSARGQGLLGWTLGPSGFVASLRGDGFLGSPSRLPMFLAAGPALGASSALSSRPGAGHAIVLMRRLLAVRPSTDPRKDRTQLSWALVAPDGTLGRVRALTTALGLTYQVKLAVNRHGDAIALWNESEDTRASYRPAGGRFSRPVTIFRGRSGDYPDRAAAIGADGRAIVVDAGAVVRARVRTRNGRFSRVMSVGRGNGSTQASAAVSNGGEAIVAWGSQDAGEEANEPWVIRAARLRRGARRFSVTQTLDPGSAIARPEGRIALAFTPGGKATIAWSAIGAQNTFPVMAAAAKHGGRFEHAQQLAPAGAVGDVAVRADGAAVVVWSKLAGPQQPIQIFGSVRPAGTPAFGSPEAIGSPDVAISPPLVAFDPASGRPTAAWAARPPWQQSEGFFDNAVVHLATRTAP
jgi:hypothetical protein